MTTNQHENQSQRELSRITEQSLVEDTNLESRTSTPLNINTPINQNLRVSELPTVARFTRNINRFNFNKTPVNLSLDSTRSPIRGRVESRELFNTIATTGFSRFDHIRGVRLNFSQPNLNDLSTNMNGQPTATSSEQADEIERERIRLQQQEADERERIRLQQQEADERQRIRRQENEANERERIRLQQETIERERNRPEANRNGNRPERDTQAQRNTDSENENEVRQPNQVDAFNLITRTLLNLTRRMEDNQRRSNQRMELLERTIRETISERNSQANHQEREEQLNHRERDERNDQNNHQE